MDMMTLEAPTSKQHNVEGLRSQPSFSESPKSDSPDKGHKTIDVEVDRDYSIRTTAGIRCSDEKCFTEFRTFLTDTIRLPQYLDNFESSQCADIRMISSFDEAGLESIGISNITHRRFIIQQFHHFNNSALNFEQWLATQKGDLRYLLLDFHGAGIFTFAQLQKRIESIKSLNCVLHNSLLTPEQIQTLYDTIVNTDIQQFNDASSVDLKVVKRTDCESSPPCDGKPVECVRRGDFWCFVSESLGTMYGWYPKCPKKQAKIRLCFFLVIILISCKVLAKRWGPTAIIVEILIELWEFFH